MAPLPDELPPMDHNLKIENIPAEPLQTSVEVTGLEPKLTKEFLMMYFENKKRSQGGPIKDIEVFVEDKRAVITFDDPEGEILFSYKYKHNIES